MKIIFFISAFLFINFNINAEIIYTDPVQDAKYVSINNSIIIGFDKQIKGSVINSVIQVRGSISGIHTGKFIITNDKMKLIFKPDLPFAFNESVEVNFIPDGSGIGKSNRISYSFRTEVKKTKVDQNQILINELGNAPYNTNPGSLPLPTLQVLESNNPSPGEIYLGSFAFAVGQSDSYLLISNNAGAYSYNRPSPNRFFDFRKQPNGMYTYFTVDKYYGEDFNHNIIDSFYCGNGYTTDFHELVLLNNGHALLMSYDPQPVDMSQVVQGGNPNATVFGLIIQEIDVNKDVVFQWRSWDHIAITDAIHENLLAASVDYIHGNAIEMDHDGNLLISSRHISEITKINRTTGDIIWRLGGVQNQFTFVNDPIKFSYQHDIRRLKNGNITLYDNGNFHSPQFSRAVEYQLDEVNKVATLVWQFRRTPDYYGFAMGTTQRLPNGNTLIGWGAVSPTLTEVRPNGQVALEMRLLWPTVSYRVFKDQTKLTLNLKLAIEGLYNSAEDRLNMKDTVRAYIRNSTLPYNIIDSAVAYVDSVNFNGDFRFYNVPTGTYYVSTKHRNSIETWSKVGGESFVEYGVYHYNFTDLISKAFGNNLVLSGSKFCFYSGDVNQDGNIDLADGSIIGNDVSVFAMGYLPTDINGDGIVDIIDALVTDNNVFDLIQKQTP